MPWTYDSDHDFYDSLETKPTKDDDYDEPEEVIIVNDFYNPPVDPLVSRY